MCMYVHVLYVLYAFPTDVLACTDFNEVVDVTMFPGGPSGPIFLDRFECSGEEASISECAHKKIHMCTHGDDVGIICHCKRITCYAL